MILLAKRVVAALERRAALLLGIPLTNESVSFEDFFHDLCVPLTEENPRLREVVQSITDEEIVLSKGEGPENVLQTDAGPIPRHGLLVFVKYFVGKRVEMILEGTDNLEDKTVLDVGASSDLIFRYIGKTGVGLNISKRAVDYMTGKGIEAVVGDAERLDYESNSFDYVLCYQTLEHLENPMAALRELGRVAREKVFISIPRVYKTRVCPFEPTNRGKHRWHCIEFSSEDFERVMTRTGLQIERRVDLTPGCGGSWKKKLFARQWRDHPWFTGFVLYQARPADAKH